MVRDRRGSALHPPHSGCGGGRIVAVVDVVDDRSRHDGQEHGDSQVLHRAVLQLCRPCNADRFRFSSTGRHRIEHGAPIAGAARSADANPDRQRGMRPQRALDQRQVAAHPRGHRAVGCLQPQRPSVLAPGALRSPPGPPSPAPGCGCLRSKACGAARYAPRRGGAPPFGDITRRGNNSRLNRRWHGDKLDGQDAVGFGPGVGQPSGRTSRPCWATRASPPPRFTPTWGRSGWRWWWRGCERRGGRMAKSKT